MIMLESDENPDLLAWPRKRLQNGYLELRSGTALVGMSCSTFVSEVSEGHWLQVVDRTADASDWLLPCCHTGPFDLAFHLEMADRAEEVRHFVVLGDRRMGALAWHLELAYPDEVVNKS